MIGGATLKKLHTCSDGGVAVSAELESVGLNGGGELSGLLSGLEIFDLGGVEVVEVGGSGSGGVSSEALFSSSITSTTVPSLPTTS